MRSHSIKETADRAVERRGSSIVVLGVELHSPEEWGRSRVSELRRAVEELVERERRVGAETARENACPRL